GEKQAAVLKAEGARTAAILRAEGESKAIETVFQAIHDGAPDQELLSYQYLQMLPQLAQGEANKIFIIPSEFNQALGNIGSALGEEDITRAMREIRLALLEADVNFKVVKQFTSAVKERCLGAEVQRQLNPGQQVVKIVNEELTSLMGGASAGLSFSPRPPTV